MRKDGEFRCLWNLKVFIVDILGGCRGLYKIRFIYYLFLNDFFLFLSWYLKVVLVF